MALGAESYLQQLQALLPKGKAWTREVGTVLTNLLKGISQEFARIDARVDDLLNEADPRTTYELIDDWERVAGLPEVGVTIEQTLAQRRAALESKLTMQGGQSRQYFIDLAAQIGYTITIVEHHASDYRLSSRYGSDRRYGGEDWNFVWDVVTVNNTIFPRKYGSNYGERYQTWGNDLLESRIRPKAPAQTLVRFIYT